MPPPITVNRRRFLGCSAAASLALSQGNLAEAAAVEAEARPVRLGVIGVGNRGTALLRALLELPGTPVVAVCDFDRRHRQRGQGIVEKARGTKPEAYEDPRRVLDRADVDAVVVALPCDLHESTYHDAIVGGKTPLCGKASGFDPGGLRSLDRRGGQSSQADRPSRVSEAVQPAVSGRRRADPSGRAGAVDRGPCHLDEQQRPRERPRRLAGPPRSVGRLDGRTGRAHLGHSAVVHGRVAGSGQRLGPARAVRRDRPVARCDRPLRRRAGMGGRVSRVVRAELGRPGRRRLHGFDSARHGRAGGL